MKKLEGEMEGVCVCVLYFNLVHISEKMGVKSSMACWELLPESGWQTPLFSFQSGFSLVSSGGCPHYGLQDRVYLPFL